MHDLDVRDPSAPPRKSRWLRRLLWVGVPLLLLIAAGVGLYVYFAHKADVELREVIAQTDRDDPTWRLVDLEANRQMIPDEENAALQVMAVKALMPGTWPPRPAQPQAPAPPLVPPGEPPGDELPPGMDRPDPAPVIPPLDERLYELPPEVQLDPVLTKDLRAELKNVQHAVDEAVKLKDMTDGRYPLRWATPVLTTLLQCQDARQVAQLLQYLAMLQAQDGDLDGALGSGRGILVCGRSIGDEPFAVSQLVRMALQAIAVRSIERTLAQGQPSAPELEALQRLLEKEAAEPLLLYASRGERAVSFETMEDVKAGRLDASQLSGLNRGGPAVVVENFFVAGLARRGQSSLLRHLNEMVAISKLPPEQQPEPMAALERKVAQAKGKGDIYVALLMPAMSKIAQAARRTQSYLRCALAAVAVERYRRDHGDWPRDLQALTPKYLAEVPADPNDGKPIRYKPVTGGAIVYSVGLDGADDGGAFNRKNPVAPGTDLVFRLWDVKERRREPAEGLPEPHEWEGGPFDPGLPGPGGP
jgi:hypothetical protein